MRELCVVIPTYDESENIARLLPALRSELEGLCSLTRVVVVDDASPDGTARVAEETGRDLRSEDFVVEVLRRPGKAGLGSAYVAAMSWLLEQPCADWVLTMDADLSHDPAHLPAFVAASERADLVVGSRYVRGAATPDWPRRRRALSTAGNLYARLWLGSELTDWTGGYNLYSRRLLEQCEPQSLRSSGYGFQIELKRRALAACDRAEEVPVVFHDRSAGTSKLPRRTILTNLLLVPRLRLDGSRPTGAPAPSGRTLPAVGVRG